MNLLYVLRDFISCKGDLRQWCKNRIIGFDCLGYVTVPAHIAEIIGTAETLFYKDILNFYILEEVETEYNYNDIRNTDIVLDIGANVGLFSLYVRNQVHQVYSVEPIFTNEIQRHIELNNAENKITILPYALSNDQFIQCQFGDRFSDVPGRSLTELKELCGGHVDFLKCDCEGGEWCIQSHELDGIRRIEVEVHLFNGENPRKFINMLESCGYIVNVDSRDHQTLLIHAFSDKTN